MSNVYHLSYYSQSVGPMDHAELQELLQRARDSNRRQDISGIPIYNSGCFLQLIEGEMEKVDLLYDKIFTDPRHRDVQLIFRQFSAERIFKKNWYMLNRNIGEYSSDVQQKIDDFIFSTANGGVTIEDRHNFEILMRAMSQEF